MNFMVLRIKVFTFMFCHHGPKYYTTSNCFGPGAKKDAMKGDNDVLETHERNHDVFDPMVQNIILPQIALAQEQKTP